MRLGIACREGPPPPEVVDLLEAADLAVPGLRTAEGPRLLSCGDDMWMLAADADVLTACARGVLDAGVVGKDVLLELAPQVHELLDLRAYPDVLVLALPAPGRAAPRSRLRVATRYPHITRRHIAASGRQAHVLEFRAATLAPALGLADGVVELQSMLDVAGSPEIEGLEVREQVAVCSARLVAGRAARALAGQQLADAVERLRDLVGSG